MRGAAEVVETVSWLTCGGRVLSKLRSDTGFGIRARLCRTDDTDRRTHVADLFFVQATLCEARFRVPKNGTQGDEKGRQRREDGIAAGDQGRDRSATFKCDCEAGRDAFSEPKIEANDISFSPLRKVGFLFGDN